MRKIFFTIVMVTLVAASVAQSPDWNNTELVSLSDNIGQKALNNGSIFIDNRNCLHVVYLHGGDGTGTAGKNLCYTMRDERNRWLESETITIAGRNFLKPNVLINPRSSKLEIYGTIAGYLHRIDKNDEQEWTLTRIMIDNHPAHEINAIVDAGGNTHIAGVTYFQNGQAKIIYYTNINGEWECYVINESQPNLSPRETRAVISANREGRVVISYVNNEGVNLLQNRAPGQDVWRNEFIRSPCARDYFSDVVVKGDVIHLITCGQNMFGNPYHIYYFTRHFHDEAWRGPELANEDVSLNEPTMVVDKDSRIHIVGVENSGNIIAYVIKYITNATVDGQWTVINPFDNSRWGNPILVLDKTNGFHLLKTMSERGIGNQEVYHKGCVWQPIVTAPRNLTAKTDSLSIVLNWDKPIPFDETTPELNGYNIHRRVGQEGITTIINEEAVEDTTYVDRELPAGRYYYFVTAIYENEEESDSSNLADSQVIEWLSAPSFTPCGGEYNSEIFVEIKAEMTSAEVYYTDDGSEPDDEAKRYTAPIVLTEDTILKARCYHYEYYPSKISTAEYKIVTTHTEHNDNLPTNQLFPAVPNPFNPNTKIAFSVEKSSSVLIEIFNNKGQKIRTLTNQHYPAGEHWVNWDGKDEKLNKQASGVYYIQMTIGNYTSTQRVVLLK